MTAAQKKARENFKKAVLYRKRTGCTLKQAFNAVKKGSVNGLDKVVKKGNKTTVLYTKKTTKKVKPKTVKQGKLFGTLKIAKDEKRLGYVNKKPKVGAINLNVIGEEFNNLDYKIYRLKNQLKDAKTVTEKSNIKKEIVILNKQFKALKLYLNTIAKFK